MTSSRSSSRQRLIRAALTLFAQQGITDTTTKQIAEQADVNEVTLFRQFGSKNGLLLAVLEEGDVFQRLSQVLVYQTERVSVAASGFDAVLTHYATAFLQALDQVPELVRSIVGEAGRVPPENRLALGRGLTHANQGAAEYFQRYLQTNDRYVSSIHLASIIHSVLLGYTIVELTGDDHELWPSRTAFIEDVVKLLCFSQSATLAPPSQALALPPPVTSELVADLPTPLVHDILQRAKKHHPQDYAILYTLFSSGIAPGELIGLQRSHHISDRNQHLLQIVGGELSFAPTSQPRQVTINQWIMGKRYGTYRNNPLTQWIRRRRDHHPALFVAIANDKQSGHSVERDPAREIADDESRPLTALTLADVQTLWDELTSDLTTLTGQRPQLEQVQQTWCVDLLMRGVTPANMQILTGWSLERLTPYIQRAQEKLAIDQVMQLDKK